MSYQDLDRDIAHLELIFGLISPSDRIPLSYWRNRLHELSGASLMPAQRARVERLRALLHALEKPAHAAHAANSDSSGPAGGNKAERRRHDGRAPSTRQNPRA